MEATTIRDIAVQLTGSNEDQIRIEHAAMLGRTLGARLTGLHVHEMPDILSITDPSGSSFLQQLLSESVDRAGAAAEKLRAALAATGLEHEVKRLDVFPNELAATLAAEARWSDLFVGTRPYGDPARRQQVEETVLFESGRPCLFVPPGHRPPESYRSVLVAWKPTREAAVALAASLPILRAADEVLVAVVEENGPSEERGEAADADIGRYLSRHGVQAEVRLVDGWSNVPAALRNEATRSGADLIVLGAYGHSRLREWALGGVTRELLSEAAVPVFTAR